MIAMAQPDEKRVFGLGWSVWRRAHQAVAARCRAARLTRGADGRTVQPGALQPATIMPQERRLTDTEWEQVRHLLPSQRPQIGRPRHNHRLILSGILSVVRTDASWREMPEEFGKWETAYKRYQLWRDKGLWRHIATTLGIQEATPNRN